ncbi:MAG: single-stranded-DNA-specific exonuclease RecJ [Spirochaetes bacterium]|nr:single-stranded-DNA-specific exonuclease RecJ [Spirochaetota bacterium]
MEVKGIKNINWYELKNDDDNFEKFLDDIETLNLEIPEKILKILYNRNINSKEKLFKFFNKDIKFLYPPFIFRNITQIIEKIKYFVNEGKKIAIYGDSDIDGVLASYILKETLSVLGSYPLIFMPDEEDIYGLSIKKINQIKEKGVELIITVDNGISSVEEINYARSLGIEVIVTDHHNPPEKLPQNCLLMNPRVEKISSLEILSGCGVVFKLIEALLFSVTRVYTNKYILFNVKKVLYEIKGEKKFWYNFFLVEIVNLKIDRVHSFTLNFDDYIKIKDYLTNVEDALKSEVIKIGQLINLEELISFFLDKLNEGFEFIFFNESLKNYFNELIKKRDIEKEKSLKYINDLYTIKKEINILEIFKEDYLFEEQKLYYLFFVALRENYSKIERFLNKLIPYVAIATISDIMPLIGENRIITSSGINSLNEKKIEVFNLLVNEIENLSYPFDSDDINWKISPLFNSPGRFGKGEVLIDLFLYKDKDKVKDILENLKNFNLKRTILIEEIVNKYKNIKLPIDNIIFIEVNDVESGLSGLLASRLANLYNKPVIVIIINKNKISGSFRTMEYLNGYEFINRFKNYFENFGGHYSACGFSIKVDLYDKFKEELKNEINYVQIDYKINNFYDCFISFDEFDENFFKWYNQLEPFGEKFQKPIFYSYPIELENIRYFGRNNNSASFKVIQEDIIFDGIFFNIREQIGELKKENIKGIIYQLQKNKLNNEKKETYLLKILDFIFE